MKLALLALIAASQMFAGDLYRHVQLPLVDCYVDSSVDTTAIPGLTENRYYVAISITTTDSWASAVAVYIRVTTEDGTKVVLRDVIGSDGNSPFTKRFSLGSLKPVKIDSLRITRLHPEIGDQAIFPELPNDR